MRPLRDHVGDILWKVPPGRVTTYGDVARALGDVVASRAVATMIMEELDPADFPTHRVVRTDGTLGGHPHGEEGKARLLAEEGVAIEGDHVVELESLRVSEFVMERPLEHLRRVQATLGARLNVGPLGMRPRTYLGVDVAYSREGPAYAAAVAIDARSSEVLYTRTMDVEVDFPYIPTYLAFREMPAVEAVLQDVDLSEALLFIDGQGTLHPRGFGIACHVGVSLGIPTIGVAKRLLCGTYDLAVLRREGQAAVLLDGEQAGWAIARRGRPSSVVFASPGHRVSVEDSLRLVRETMGRRQPEALELAHAAASAAKRDAHSTTSSLP